MYTHLTSRETRGIASLDVVGSSTAAHSDVLLTVISPYRPIRVRGTHECINTRTATQAWQDYTVSRLLKVSHTMRMYQLRIPSLLLV